MYFRNSVLVIPNSYASIFVLCLWVHWIFFVAMNFCFHENREEKQEEGKKGIRDGGRG